MTFYFIFKTNISRKFLLLILATAIPSCASNENNSNATDGSHTSTSNTYTEELVTDIAVDDPNQNNAMDDLTVIPPGLPTEPENTIDTDNVSESGSTTNIVVINTTPETNTNPAEIIPDFVMGVTETQTSNTTEADFETTETTADADEEIADTEITVTTDSSTPDTVADTVADTTDTGVDNTSEPDMDTPEATADAGDEPSDNAAETGSGIPSSVEDTAENTVVDTTETGTENTTDTGGLNNTENPATNSIALSWVPPIERDDGKNITLSEIAGYRIYYGDAEGNYPHQIIINNSGISEATIEYLTSGTYHIVMTTVDVNGRESAYSTVIVQTI